MSPGKKPAEFLDELRAMGAPEESLPGIAGANIALAMSQDLTDLFASDDDMTSMVFAIAAYLIAAHEEVSENQQFPLNNFRDFVAMARGDLRERGVMSQ